MEETQAKVPTAAPSEPVDAPAAGLRGFARRHPQLTAWAALAIVMVALVLWSARDVDLLLTQRLSIVLATVGLAGLCVWIIGWD